MGRNWSPKFTVVCSRCGWTGRRTKRTVASKCPQCYFWHPRESKPHGVQLTINKINERTR